MITASEFYKWLRVFGITQGGGDPGALLAVNNLSDVASAAQSRLNLQVPHTSTYTGNPNTHVAGAVGDFVQDITIPADPVLYVCIVAGVAADAEWLPVGGEAGFTGNVGSANNIPVLEMLNGVVINALEVPPTGGYRVISGTTGAFQTGDENCTLSFTNGGASTCTISPQASTQIGTPSSVKVRNSGAGTVTVTPGSGVTLVGGAFTITGNSIEAVLQQTNTNIWELMNPGEIPFYGQNLFTATTRTLAASDQLSKQLYFNASDTSITVPPNTFSKGTSILFQQYNSGNMLFVEGAGVSILYNGVNPQTNFIGDTAVLYCLGNNVFLLSVIGGMAAQNPANVAILGGAINGTLIGNDTPSTIAGTAIDLVANDPAKMTYFNISNLGNVGLSFILNEITANNSTPAPTQWYRRIIDILDNTAGDELSQITDIIRVGGFYQTTAIYNNLGLLLAAGLNAGNDGTFAKSASGDITTLAVLNSSNTANSDSVIRCGVGGSSAGDAYFQAVGVANNWTFGLDQSDARKFVLSQGVALGTNNVITATLAGEVNMPLQPAFSAFLTSQQSNVTGDATVYKIICNNEIFDQNSDYNNSTGVFTASVSGRYLFSIGVITVGGTTMSGLSSMRINTSNRLYLGYMNTAYSGNYAGYMTYLCDMDIGDTAEFDVSINDAGGKIVDVYGEATNVLTFFSGKLDA